MKLDPKLPQDVKLVSDTFNKMLDNLQNATAELEDWSQQLEDKVQKKRYFHIKIYGLNL